MGSSSEMTLTRPCLSNVCLTHKNGLTLLQGLRLGDNQIALKSVPYSLGLLSQENTFIFKLNGGPI